MDPQGKQYARGLIGIKFGVDDHEEALSNDKPREA